MLNPLKMQGIRPPRFVSRYAPITDQQYYNFELRQHYHESRKGMLWRFGDRRYIVKSGLRYMKPWDLNKRRINRPVIQVYSKIQSYSSDVQDILGDILIRTHHRTGILMTRKIRSVRRYLSHEEPWR